MAPASLDEFQETIAAAAAAGRPLRLRGGGSKDFYGGMLAGEVLSTSAYRGIVAFEPSELYLTARCGTPLAEIDALLAEKEQMLACEPPHGFGHGEGGVRGGNATVGGAVAAGLSGPRRVQVGGLRDFVLGARLIDGRGQLLEFGGQVIKNVAGYDVSRLLAGSLGTLGLLAEVTLKVLPRPQQEICLGFEFGEAEAIAALNRWAGQPLPLSASFWYGGRLLVRLSGAQAAVAAARSKLGGEAVGLPGFWDDVREHRHPAFAGDVLWRIALPSTAAPLNLPGAGAIEWGGGQRWLAADLDPDTVRDAAARAGGHAVLFRAPESQRCRTGAFAPPTPAVLALHRRVKQVFDPHGILNPGRLYAEL